MSICSPVSRSATFQRAVSWFDRFFGEAESFEPPSASGRYPNTAIFTSSYDQSTAGHATALCSSTTSTGS
jgi:hypothetical protein